MRLKYIVLGLACGIGISAAAQVNSPQSGGYIERAALMLADGNYIGCIDQCKAAMKSGSPEREKLMWLQAVASYKAGLTDAGSLLTTFCQQYPHSPKREPARLMLASLPFFQGNYSLALRQLNQISHNALEPAQAEQLDYRRAFSMLKLGQLDGSESLFTSLSNKGQYSNPAKFYLGYIAYLREDYPKAINLLQEVDRTREPGSSADYYLSQIRYKEGDYKEALRLAEPLINSSSEFASEAQRVCGESQYALGNESKALSLLRPYMEQHPEDAPLSVRYIVGTDDYSRADYDRAIDLLAPVTELHNAMGQSAALTIGQSYLSEGNAAAAILSFEKAVKMDFDPDITEQAYYNYAVAQVDGGRVPFGSSVQTLEDFIRRYPNSRNAATVQDYLVKGYMATNDYEGALRSLNALKTNTPQIQSARQQVLFVLGSRALQSGDASKAIELLTQSEKLKKHNADIGRQTTLWLADAYYEQQNYKQAEKYYNEFLRGAANNDPNRATATYNLAYSLFGSRKYDDARAQFKAAEQLNQLPADAKTDARTRIADTYYYGSDFNAALKTYKEAYDLNPRTGDYALLQQAIMQGHLGKRNDKLGTIDKVLSQFPQSPLRPEALTEKALTLSAIGKQGDAIATYETIATEFAATKQGRNALLQLGILNNNGGKTDRAIEYYKQVITRHPSSSEATVAVQDLKNIYAERGDIEELNSFLVSTAGAPQLDEVERNAIAAAQLLRKARAATQPAERLSFSEQMLVKYPDAEGAEEAMSIAAKAEYDLGKTENALTRYAALEKRASTATMRHTARMGQLRSARDLGRNDVIIKISKNILESGAAAGSDLPEVKFIRAGALADSGQETEALTLRRELSKHPENIYGTRAAFDIADGEFRNNNLTNAQKEIEALIDANPPHAYWLARSYVLLSDILRAQGNDFEANEYLKVLRDNYPGTDADIFQMIDKRLQK
ncbi:MAG: tetratricopeptide repeat protein [Muribaculaceae bacterium]|nr:tetratricopeptide repeat protein [Muribaculaceae bacterium]